ncbi:hypothetical protein SVAN01_11759 [Stagonosporopsis vannaccii]|nr:hypothetical protein SVAN01_11759 [Stagonosporopsis vannaccii]
MASTAFIRTTFLQTASVTSTVIRPPTAPTAAAPDNTGVSSNPETPPAVASGGGGQGGPVGQSMSSSFPLFNAGGPAQPPLPPSGTSGLGEVPNAALDAGAVAALPSDSNAQDVPQAGATPIQTQSDGTQANSEGASPAVQPGAGDGNAAGTVSAPSNDQEAAASDDASDDADETGIVPDDTSTSDDQPVESTGAAPHNTEATLETLLAAFAVVAFLQL